MTKKQKIATIAFASILFLSVITVTYAFFTANSNPMNSSSTSITTGSLTLTLDDAANSGSTVGGAITPNNLSYTTYLSIRNDSPIDVYARILFKGLTNTYSKYLVYTLEQVNQNKTSLSPVNIIKNQKRIPASASVSNQELANGLNIVAGQTQYYKVTIEYLYSNTVDQSSDLNKTFYTGFIIEEGSEPEPIPTKLSEYLVYKEYTTNQDGADPDDDNEAGLYYHSSTCTNGCAQDGAYRYAGAGGISCTYNQYGHPTSCNYSSNLDLVNNWVCFGTDNANTCKNDTSLNNKSAYLYRIMGVYEDKVKLIKADSIGNYAWNSNAPGSSSGSPTPLSNNNNSYKLELLGSGDYNDWATQSTLRPIINDESDVRYLGKYTSAWKSKIAPSTWYIGGYSSSYVTPKVFYDAEFRGTCSSGTCPGTTLTNTKVGLMNASEYGYSASSNYWNRQFNNYSQAANYDYGGAVAYNWLYQGVENWTISPYSSYASGAWYVSRLGSPGDYLVYFGVAVRPVFYLSSSVEYVSGTGTYADPYIIG